MKALVKSESGLSLTEVPTPDPGPGEVLVRVMCAGLCRTDIYLADDLLKLSEPRILGHEFAGVIYRLGGGVPQERLGDKVTVFPWMGCGHCNYCADDQEKLGYLCPERRFLGWDLDGCFAEFVCLPAARCVTIPPGVSFQAGAFTEPLMAALGVLRAPLSDAAEIGVLGNNRITNLTSIVLREMGKFQHQLCPVGEGVDNSFDLLIETEASAESLCDAMRLIRPDGLLVLKSRPPVDVCWPLRIQVEKEISTMALGYGTMRMALMLLQHKAQLFRDIWAEPVSLADWQNAFAQARGQDEVQKLFFLPRGQ